MTDETALIVAEPADEKDITVVARNPADMAAAQVALIDWAKRKIESETKIREDADANYQQAIKAKWRSRSWERVLNLAAQRVTFYEKLLKALELGYYIVPPFDVELFAIRTTRKSPDSQRTDYQYHNFEQKPKLLPEGAGDYVSPQPEVHYRSLPGPVKDGKPTETKEYYAHSFLDVDFPFKLARPAVLAETTKAMALRLFDQLGVLPRTRAADPIVVGQIIPPHRRDRPVTFFVAWWLNTEDL